MSDPRYLEALEVWLSNWEQGFILGAAEPGLRPEVLAFRTYSRDLFAVTAKAIGSGDTQKVNALMLAAAGQVAFVVAHSVKPKDRDAFLEMFLKDVRESAAHYVKAMPSTGSYEVPESA